MTSYVRTTSTLKTSGPIVIDALLNSGDFINDNARPTIVAPQILTCSTVTTTTNATTQSVFIFPLLVGEAAQIDYSALCKTSDAASVAREKASYVIKNNGGTITANRTMNDFFADSALVNVDTNVMSGTAGQVSIRIQGLAATTLNWFIKAEFTIL